jgi:hypothetical protein
MLQRSTHSSTKNLKNTSFTLLKYLDSRIVHVERLVREFFPIDGEPDIELGFSRVYLPF